jgi:DNA-3-methyladenine glycosylase I
MLILEGAQAALSWITILRKREGYRRAFHGFDPQRVAQMTEEDVERLMQDSGIVRNRLKIRSAIRNARCSCNCSKSTAVSITGCGATQGQSVLNHWPSLQDCPASTALSDQISKSLKKPG